MKTYFGFAIADSMFPRSEECTIIRREIDVDTVRKMIADAIICLNPSHKATISAMRERFGIDVAIPEMPPRVELKEGDCVIVMGIRGLPRLTDRHEYTDTEIAGAEFRFCEYRVTRVVKACPSGWQKFRFCSSWDGSIGEGKDLDVRFYFRPGLEIGRWEEISSNRGFVHRNEGGNSEYLAFRRWIDALQEGIDYINADELMI